MKKVHQEITVMKQQTNKIAANAVKCLWVRRSAEMPRDLRKQRPGRAAAKTTATKIYWQQQQRQQGQQRSALEENMTGPSKQRKLRSPHSYLDTFFGGEFVVVDQLL